MHATEVMQLQRSGFGADVASSFFHNLRVSNSYALIIRQAQQRRQSDASFHMCSMQGDCIVTGAVRARNIP